MVTEGNDNNVPSNGQVNLNTVLAALGTAGFFGFNAGNMFGGNRPPMEPMATRYDLENQKATERAMTEKDMEIARLKAEKYADSAALAAERRLADKIEKIETTMTAGFRAQGEYNVANTAAVANIGNQAAQLMKMTNLIIAAPAFAESQAAASVFTAKTATTAAQGNG
jgi:hypothetical protein